MSNINNEFMNKLRERQEEEKVKKDEIDSVIKDTSYFRFLDYILLDDDILFDTDIVYGGDISPSQRDDLNKLGFFFEAIDKYAKENYYYPLMEGDSVSYTIYLGSVIITIGYTNDEKKTFFCERTSREDAPRGLINLEDIIGNVPRKNKNEIKENIAAISDNIVSLMEKGVPSYSIVAALQKAIDELILREKNNFVRKFTDKK